MISAMKKEKEMQMVMISRFLGVSLKVAMVLLVGAGPGRWQPERWEGLFCRVVEIR